MFAPNVMMDPVSVAGFLNGRYFLFLTSSLSKHHLASEKINRK